MQDTDVPPSPGPIRGTPSGSLASGRFILQHFRRQDEFVSQFAPHKSG